MVYHSVFK